MLDIQKSCTGKEVLPFDVLKPGLPCCALFEMDQQWYRSEVVDVQGPESVKVHYVDYGNDEIVPVTFLREIDGQQLTVLRPQAIECCLNG